MCVCVAGGGGGGVVGGGGGGYVVRGLSFCLISADGLHLEYHVFVCVNFIGRLRRHITVLHKLFPSFLHWTVCI